MAYHLHIRRRTLKGEDSPITRDEWLGYLKGDPDFTQIDCVQGVNPRTGAMISIPGDMMAEWTALGRPGPTFNYFEGQVSAPFRGRDDDVIRKMKDVAAALDARVFGDEGEEY